MNTRIFTIVGLVAALASGVNAQQSGTASGTNQPANDSTMSGKNTDAMVLSKMHQKNQAEMKVGQLAMEKGQSEKVRRYGKQLYADHQFADQKIQALAQKKGITLTEPKPMTDEDRKNAENEKMMMQKLQQAQGEQFDQTLAQAMDEGHHKVIQSLNQAVGQLQDSDVRALVQKMIPILEQHRTLAQDLEGRLEPTGRAQR